MADLQYVIDVNYDTLSRAVDELVRTGKAADDTGKAFQQAFRLVVQWQDKFAAQQGKVNAALENSVLKHNLSNKAAKESAKVFEDYYKSLDLIEKQEKKTAEEALRSAETRKNALNTVLRSIDPVKNASMDFENKLEILNKELKDKSPEEYARALDMLRKQAQRSGVVLSSTNKVIGLSNKTARQNEVAFQQAGYQIQDFIVQVQAGTNPLIAFSQQGSQLAGFFAGPWGAAIGLGIAALSSLAMVLLNTSDKARSFSDSMSDVSSSLSDYNNAADDVDNSKLNETFGIYSEAARGLSESVKGVNLEIAKLNLAEAAGELLKDVDLTTSAEGFTKGLKVGLASLVSGSWAADIQSQSPLKDLGFDKLLGADSGFGEGGLQKFFEKLKKSIQAGMFKEAAYELQFLYDKLNESGDQLNLQGLTLVSNLDSMVKSGLEVQAAMDGTAKAAEGQNTQLESGAKIQEVILDTQTKVEENQVKILKAQGDYNGALKLAKDLAYEKAYQDVMSKFTQEEINGLTTEQLSALNDSAEKAGELAENAVDVAFQTSAAKREAQELAKALREAVSAMSSLESFGAGIERQLASEKAKAEALASGANFQVAAKIATERFDAEAKFWKAFESATNTEQQDEALAVYSRALSDIEELKTTMESNAEKLKAQREAAKGGGKGKDNVSSLAESLLSERELIDAWYAESLAKLENFNALELEVLGGHANARYLIEQEYQSKLQGLRNQQLTDAGTFFGALASVAQAGGGKMVKAAAVFSASQALINSYVAYTEMLKDPSFVGRPWARFAAAAGVLASGLQMVQAIKGVGSGGGAVPSGAAASMSTSAAAAPQRVIIEGLDRNALYTGDQLANIFDALYKENKDRGFVFEVAR